MLRDVLADLPAVVSTIDTHSDRWVCLGVVESHEDVDAVQQALGPRYQVLAEPFEEDIAIAGGHPWIRGTRSWEVWARRA